MTFDGWFEGKDCDGACYIFAEAAWNAGQAAEREKYAELIAAAEAVIETAKRHRNVGYADRQMVYLNATVERFKNEN